MTTMSGRIDLEKYVTIPIWYKCNNNCILCMLSDLKKRLPFIDFERYKGLVTHAKEELKFENLILSGAEVSTFEDLGKYIEYAASLGWFKKIQVQTNGRRLGDAEYLRQLIDAGVNEFFISIHGNETSHDTLTRRSGSFNETFQGIQNLKDFDVNVITNTVLTTINYLDVIPLMTVLAQEGVSELHLWDFLPMEQTDTRDLLVSVRDIRALFSSLFPKINVLAKPLVLKNFPECICRRDNVVLDNGFPLTFIGETYWKAFGENQFGQCYHWNNCRTQKCWGLTIAHVKKYGDERELLSPII